MDLASSTTRARPSSRAWLSPATWVRAWRRSLSAGTTAKICATSRGTRQRRCVRQFEGECVVALRCLVLVKSALEPADGVTAEQKAEMVTAVKGGSVAILL